MVPPADSSSWATSEAARRTMMGNRSKDTAPELRVRSSLHRAGLRFRKHFRPLPSLRATVDVAFTSCRLAVQIDGCFWHGCPVHGTRPARNTSYWNRKLDRNIERDRQTDRLLTDAGWRVLRFWEHEDPREVVEHVIIAIGELQALACAQEGR